MYTSYQMIMLRKKLLDKVLAREMKIKDAAFLLDTRRETVSRWLAKYKFDGLTGITPKKPGPKNGTAHNRTKTNIEDEIILIAEENPFKGPEWIADQLSYTLHPTTVYRILKRRSVRYGPHYRHKRRKKKRYCLDRPGRELQVDVCFPFGRARDEVVYDAIDDCSRWVFAKVMPNASKFTTIKFFTELIKRVPFRIEAIRTDQGSEFSTNISIWLAKQGIKHHRNPPYTPQHNGKIERYHRTFRENECYMWPFKATSEELNYRLSLWLKYYNYQKKHGGLGMNKLTPVQKLLFVFMGEELYPKNVTRMLQQYIF